jgi:hypothetical protein
MLYLEKLSFNIKGRIKIFHDKQKLKQHMTTNPPLEKILKGILHTEDENKHNLERVELLNLKRRANKQSESSIELVAHTQTITQEK